MNIYEYFLTANTKNRQKTAMSIRLDGGVRSYTYGQLFNQTDIFAEALKKAGIKPGNRIAVIAENCPEWCAAYLAAAKLRATSVLIDASLEREELCRLIDKSKVRCICTTPKTFEKLNSFSGVPVVNILDDAGFFAGYECVCASKETDGDEKISTIIFSSGTTRAASGIMHSHESMIGTSKMIEKYLDVNSSDKSLAVIPNNHIYGLITQIIIPLYLGASVCFLESINGEMINGALQEFQPTFLPAVPKMYELFKSQVMRKIDGDTKTQKLFNKVFPKCLALRRKTGINAGKIFFKDIHKAFGSKMRILCSAGAPLNAETAEFFYGVGFDILITYGATETNIPTLGNYGGRITTDTCGRAYPDISVKLSGEGEILIKSPYMMLGYFDDETATRNAYDENGWFKTGDLGSLDTQTGHIKITGRLKDNIVLATGKKVAPDDIESAYEDIDGVTEFVVCGIPAQNCGHDEVHAFVVAGQSATESAVTELVKQRSASMPHNMKLADIHFVDAIPKTSLQKPKRYLLKQAMEQNIQAVAADSERETPIGNDIDFIIRKTIAKIAKVDISEVLPETKLFSELAIDSLGSIELCCELEEKCGINAGIAYLIHKEMTVAELTEYAASPVEDKIENHSSKQIYPLNKTKRDYNIYWFIQRLLHRIYNIRIAGENVLPKDGGYIICANHVSNFDYLFLTLNFKWARFSKFCCMAKKELFSKNILSRAVAKIAGMIPVDRCGFVNDAFEAVCGKLKENWGVLIHPEGTRSSSGEMSAFKKGAALLSIESGVPIIPAYIEGGYEVYPKSKKLPHFFNWKEKKKYCVEVKYGEPISPKGLNADELIKMVEFSVLRLKNSINVDSV